MRRSRFAAMGGTVELSVPGGTPATAEAALLRARAVFAEIERAATRFRDDSPWVALNRALGEWQTVPSLLADLAAAADLWRRATAGLFDPRILPALERAGYRGAAATHSTSADAGAEPWWQAEPTADPSFCRMRLLSPADLGGIGKGFACDRAAEALRPLLPTFLLDAGGDMALQGRGDRESGAWTIGLEDPRTAGSVRACFAAVAPCAIATSSTARRHWELDGIRRHHLIDPRTGQPAATGIAAVTVVAETVVGAEAMAKALLIGGPEWLRGTEAWTLPVWWADADGALAGNAAARGALLGGPVPG